MLGDQNEVGEIRKGSEHAVCVGKSFKELFFFFFFPENRCAYFSKTLASLLDSALKTISKTLAYILFYRSTYSLVFK